MPVISGHLLSVLLTSNGELPAVFQTSLSSQHVGRPAANKLPSIFNGRDKDQGAHSHIPVWAGLKSAHQGNCFRLNQGEK